ncbi:hypothetical protein GGS23DRAFT_600170 [Durotheca rogersii]|uniref:uncharacterized protein n=1 Tax=Durotheca rogersii TaxID=419775 RepID=UPI002220FA22|nr:uncharacterized protein GGS23DRAFT_600170 [Durotheca rogersii]KAI5859644.1 hypothetical protein GGS23DRAFT_600170 [Durotheca rogersii]
MEADHLLILDEGPRRYYSSILSRPDAYFCTTESGPNLAVVGSGGNLQAVVQEIAQSHKLEHGLAAERLTAVFVREENTQTLARELTRLESHQSRPGADSRELETLGFRLLGADAYQCELSRLLRWPEHSLAPVVRAARKSDALFVLLYTYLDQVMDAISRLESLPSQVAFLAPESEASAQYLEQWSRSKMFSLGSIRSVIPPGVLTNERMRTNVVIASGKPLGFQDQETLFPPTTFGEVREIVSGRHVPAPSLQSVQAQNKGVIRAVAPDPNQTMEFFGYVICALTYSSVILGGLALGGVYIRYLHSVPMGSK